MGRNAVGGSLAEDMIAGKRNRWLQEAQATRNPTDEQIRGAKNWSWSFGNSDLSKIDAKFQGYYEANNQILKNPKNANWEMGTENTTLTPDM